MTPAEIVSLLSNHNISLRVENGSLKYHAPKGAMTDEFRNILKEKKERLISFLNSRGDTFRDGIAVIGMACRFPGADTPEQYWANIRNGIESIRHYTADELDIMGVSPEIYNSSNFVRAASVIDDIEMFDAPFFGYSPREAEIIDPQQRIFLECAYTALEDAGYDPGSYQGKIALFGGSGSNYYRRYFFSKAGSSNVSEMYQVELGNETDYLSTRVAYKLGLRGPAITIQTACSTSLVAAHMACQSVLSGECDMALAGGVSINILTKGGYFYEQGMIPSPDGHCRAFDAKAQGTVLGQGAGIVVLKRLSEAIADGDMIHAVIKGSAINNDGAAKVGFTAPGIGGQCDVILSAQKAAGISPEDIGYIEAHGTGTPLGDPIEIKALTKAFRFSTDKCGYCPIGSVKTNIGHLDAAAGVAGLIKVILMLQHKELPPSLHFEEANPNLELGSSPFFVNSKLREWETNEKPRYAGVSSFGLGGTNAHMILEEAPPFKHSGQSRERHIMAFSARTEDALKTHISNVSTYINSKKEHVNAADVSFSLLTSRRAFIHRATVMVNSMDDAAAALSSVDNDRIIYDVCPAGNRDVIFMFSGQGSQYPGMGRGLYIDEPVFRKHIDNCSEILKKYISIDLRDLFYPDPEYIKEAGQKLEQTSITQPALFSIEYALAKLWMSWGVNPKAMVGHSIGEYTAACLAGVFELEDALRVVAARGRLMQSMPPGAMLAVFLAEEQLTPFMNDNLSLSVLNSPTICVVSGGLNDIEAFESELKIKGITNRRLHTSHAFHSKMMDPVLTPFLEEIKQVELRPPKMPFLSNVTGTWISEQEAVDYEYWVKHLRNTVRFSDCLNELFKEPDRVLMEVGPGNTLNVLAGQHPSMKKSHVVLHSVRHPKEEQPDSPFIIETLCSLWRAGVDIKWQAFFSGETRQKISLPSYPFERRRFWVESPSDAEAVNAGSKKGWFEGLQEKLQRSSHHEQKTGKKRNIKAEDLQRIWSRTLGIPTIGVDDNFFEMGGHSLLAVSIITELEKGFGVRLSLASLIEAPTIKLFMHLLNQKESGTSSSYLITLNASGSKPPFFLLHSHGGNILEYHPLANHIKDNRPVYAIQCRGLDGSPVEDMSVEEMAVTYLREIRRVQPKGPYYLGGYCFGGYLSLEIAHLLNAENEKVELMVMINSATHLFNNYEPGMTKLHRKLCALKDRFELEWSELSGQPIKKKMQRIMMRAGRMYDLAQNKVEKLMDRLPDGFPLKTCKHSFVYHLEQIADANDLAWERYRPKAYDGKVIFLRAERQPNGLIPDPLLGWKDYLTGELHVFEVPGFRQTMLDEPNVTKMAEIILKYLP